MSSKDLRKFHNLVKRELITSYIAPKAKLIIDVGAGKMGDRDKFIKMGCARVLCLDVNMEFIQQGQKRTSESKFTKFEWAHVDLSSVKGIEKLLQTGIVSLPESVSCFSFQFSLGQITGSSDHLRQVVQWIATFLVPGGTWIGTLFDDANILKLLDKDKKLFKSDSMIVSLDQSLHDWNRVQVQMAESETAINLTETLVPWMEIVKVARDCGLELIHSAIFSEWFKLLGQDCNLSESDKLLSFANRSFCFYKCVSIPIS